MGELIEERFNSTVKDAMRFRDRVGDERFYDMNYETLVKDIPVGVRQIKEHFGLPHGPENDQGGEHQASRDQAETSRSSLRGRPTPRAR